MRKKNETSRAGVWFYSLATVATGILDIVWGAFEPSHQPIQSLAYSWRTCTRVPCRGLASHGWHGDLVATCCTDGNRGVSHDLRCLWPILAASVSCYDAEVRLSHGCHHFRLRRNRRTDIAGRPRSNHLPRDYIPRYAMARKSSCRRPLDVGVAPDLLWFRAPGESSCLCHASSHIGCRSEISG